MITTRVPGDKSIAHRALILACIAEGTCYIRQLPVSKDLISTRVALTDLGARISSHGTEALQVAGRTDWIPGTAPIDCGNSGTTARLLSGLLVGLGLPAVVTGDDSLRQRPMDRVVYPLQSMGGRISYCGERDRLPIAFAGRTTGSLRVLRYRGRTASAQVKSALLLAGLTSGTEVEVREPGVSRDHTERLLASLGVPLEFGPLDDGGARVILAGSGVPFRLPRFDMSVPGDASSAAFLIAAAVLAGREIRVEGVGLNSTRTGYLRVLRRMGVRVSEEIVETRFGEPVGTIDVTPAPLNSFDVAAQEIPGLVDEIPILAVLAARANGTSRIAGATELRVKESDRLHGLASNFAELGVDCEERHDGLRIRGSKRSLVGRVRTDGDHRIAMAFGVLGASQSSEILVDDRACVDVSYPGFWAELDRIASGGVS